MIALPHTRLAALLAPLVLGAVAALACGSVSETPWPVEPLDIEPGPEGEDRPPGTEIDVCDLPVDPRWRDAGTDGGEEPTDEE